MMDDILTYEHFIKSYPNSKLTESEYNIYYRFAKEYILNQIVYDYNILSLEQKNTIYFYILFQVNYFEKNGLEKSGIVSESINGTSLSINSDNKQGELNIAGIVKNWLTISSLGVRRL